jgi:predicted PurR-regulated permease PerM
MIDKLSSRQTKYIAQAVIVVFAIFLLYTLRIFMDAFLGAVIIYVLFRPMMRYMAVKLKWNRSLSAILVILATLFIVIIPVTLIVSYVVPKLISLASDSASITNAVRVADEKIRTVTGKQLLKAKNIQAVSAKATEVLTGFLGTTFSLLTDILIMYFLLYYMLVSTGNLEKAFEKYVPFSHENILRFSHELQGMTYSNAFGAPLLAMVQGLAAAIGFWMFGVDEPLFWGIMCGIFALLPAVGTPLIWGPAVIIKFSEGYTGQAAGLLIFCLIFVVGVEYFLRIALQKRMVDVHPIITILGFIIGIELFGLPGIIFGPLLLSWFLLLIEIYQDEFLHHPQKKKLP